MRRLRRFFLLAAKHLYLGLVYVGAWSTPAAMGEFLHRGQSVDGSGCGPAPGHPERLVPGRPLSEVERGLWRQLLP
ncbi:DUF6059 family protein [Phytohabitans sp. LJ34]|uniref:DUF6059 family protein n=1 Tax=Phytohabitans sp. LJ34 TaxID=3452217 RepID=UPI003F8B6CBE